MFDITNTNVARGKRCYSNAGLYSGRTDVGCEKALDNLASMDYQSDVGDPGGLFHAGSTATGTFWEVDLGA